MIFYELTYLINPELTEEKAEEAFKELEKAISQQGKIIASEKPRKIVLAYPIKKKSQAFLALIRFEGETEAIKAINDNLKNEQTIIRFLLTKHKKVEPKKEKKVKPSILKKPAKKKTKVEERKVDMAEIEKELDQIL